MDEVLALLAPKPGERYADATAGLGGHAAQIARRIESGNEGEGNGGEGNGGAVVLNDLDDTNLASAAAAVRAAAPAVAITTHHGSFARLPAKLEDEPVDLLLADLGFASGQIADASRGFSFKRDGPLDMRMNPRATITAAELVATLSEEELAEIIFRFGEERNARAVARKLVAQRAVDPITTTAQLARIVRSAVRTRGTQSIDPATRTFQALRIAVNDEIGSVESLLRSISQAAARLAEGGARNGARTGAGTGAGNGAGAWLCPGARIAVISFHSLEDRPVKKAFAALAERGLAEAVSRKPVRAGEDELARNVRARSAKLRVIRLRGEESGR
jgi:16S rRNA (cytosine1402-N4)-methyltransferase